MKTERIIKSGENCWRVAHADRAAFLVDGAAYFHAFKSAVEQARRSVFIVGWDIDSRLRLERGDGDGEGGLPDRLSDFICAAVRRHKRLEVYILIWDYAMIYAAERQWLPIYRFGWQAPHRVHFRMDDVHPTGASHHQKIVVVDDRVAFVGGFDLAKWRWDTPAHASHEARRTDPLGNAYPPFHDIQLMVEGECAGVLGGLARERWHRATGRRPGVARRPVQRPCWPADVTADMHDLDIGIARTDPGFQGRPATREVEHLFLDAIAAARRWIYIENQYLTADCIRDALAARLREPGGPEIVLILPRETGGWLEQNTMDVLRHRVLTHLHEADGRDRLRAYYPVTCDDEVPVMVHSKVMVVDDRLIDVGSANLSNRSMGLDTECNLAVEDHDGQAGAIAAFRNRLLAEHLGVRASDVQAALDRHGSLIAAIESLRGRERTLKTLNTEVSPAIDGLVPETVDPERPIEPEQLAERLMSADSRPPGRTRIFGAAGVLIAMALLALAWRWSPLADRLDLQEALATVRAFKDNAAAPILVLGAYTIGCLIAVPVTLLVITTMLVFEPLTGISYAIAGSALGASANYVVGHLLGRNIVRRLAGSRINELSRRLARRAVLTVIVLRMVPVAPYTVINMVAGASHIRFRDFFLGTVIGMSPGIVVIGIVVDQLTTTMQRPSSSSLIYMSAGLIALGLGVFALRWWLLRREQSDPQV